MKRNHSASLLRQLQLFDDSYEVYMVLPSDLDSAGDCRVEVLRITGQDDCHCSVAIN